jgi:hypothetical protein
MSRLRTPALLSHLALAFLGPSLACNTPPKEAHDGASAPPASSTASAAPVASSTASAPAASASAPAPASAPASAAACTKDDDCRLFSSYCAEAPCACRALAPRDANPSCLGDAGSKVRCFVDPCMSKAAHCQSGACVLTAK